MYYRIAIQVEAQPPWKWQSTVLSSLGSLLQWLQVYRAFPQELNEQLARENQGLCSSGVPALQFLHERRIASQGAVREAALCGTRANEPTASISAKPSPSPDEGGMSPLDKQRTELERGAGCSDGQSAAKGLWLLPQRSRSDDLLSHPRLLVDLAQAGLGYASLEAILRGHPIPPSFLSDVLSSYNFLRLSSSK
jgi:hypothetical protein